MGPYGGQNFITLLSLFRPISIKQLEKYANRGGIRVLYLVIRQIMKLNILWQYIIIGRQTIKNTRILSLWDLVDIIGKLRLVVACWKHAPIPINTTSCMHVNQRKEKDNSDWKIE